jgi:hypothetical protein
MEAGQCKAGIPPASRKNTNQCMGLNVVLSGSTRDRDCSPDLSARPHYTMEGQYEGEGIRVTAQSRDLVM